MAEFPTMPFHTDAYLADTRHLTTIEHGAYMLLLITAWRNGGSLPNDDKLLARYASLGPRQWQRIKPTIMQFFNEENGSLYNGKLSDTLVAVRTKSEKASDSARAKWRKNKDTVSANACPKQSERNAIQSQSQIEDSEPNGSGAKAPDWKKGSFRGKFSLPVGALRQAFREIPALAWQVENGCQGRLRNAGQHYSRG